LQLLKTKLLKHADVRMIEDVIQNVQPFLFRVRIQQRLGNNAVCEEKYSAQQREVDQLPHL